MVCEAIPLVCLIQTFAFLTPQNGQLEKHVEEWSSASRQRSASTRHHIAWCRCPRSDGLEFIIQRGMFRVLLLCTPLLCSSASVVCLIHTSIFNRKGVREPWSLTESAGFNKMYALFCFPFSPAIIWPSCHTQQVQHAHAYTHISYMIGKKRWNTLQNPLVRNPHHFQHPEPQDRLPLRHRDKGFADGGHDTDMSVQTIRTGSPSYSLPTW